MIYTTQRNEPHDDDCFKSCNIDDKMRNVYNASDKSWIRQWLSDDVDPTEPLDNEENNE